MDKIFFAGWESLARTAIITVMAYVSLVFLLRVFGKRTLSQMNAFDFIVTVALGSTLATVMLSKSVVFADGVLAFFLLILLQFIITWLSVRSSTIRGLVKGNPTLLVYQGRLLEDAMRKQRITKEDVFQKIRDAGFDRLEDVGALVMETAGHFSILGKIENRKTRVMDDVEGWKVRADKEA